MDSSAVANAGTITVAGPLLDEVANDGDLSARIALDLKDGKVDADEALDLLRAIRERRTFEDRHLVPNLRACASTVMA
jgi:hypothetical protein